MAATMTKIGEEAENLHVGFPTGVEFDTIKIRQTWNETNGNNQVDEVMGEDGNLAVIITSDDRLTASFTGYLASNSTIPKNGDTVDVTGFKYGIIRNVNIQYTSKLATVSGEVLAWGRE